MIYALAHFTKLKPTIDPVKCHYIIGEEITQFHQRNQMISENAWNALTRNGGSIYKLYEGYNLYIYHFSVGIQRRRSVFNSHIARAISWESGLPMTLIPSQFKESMRFDSLY